MNKQFILNLNKGYLKLKQYATDAVELPFSDHTSNILW